MTKVSTLLEHRRRERIAQQTTSKSPLSRHQGITTCWVPNVTCTCRLAPAEFFTVSVAWAPGVWERMAAIRASPLSINRSSTLVIMSPGWMPAAAAAVPGVTCWTTAAVSSGCAAGTVTPSKACVA